MNDRIAESYAPAFSAITNLKGQEISTLDVCLEAVRDRTPCQNSLQMVLDAGRSIPRTTPDLFPFAIVPADRSIQSPIY